jgi:hypothetical protein
MLRGWKKPDVDFALGAEWFLDPDESELLELPEPSLDGAAAAVEFLLEPPVPEPVGVGAEAVEISEDILLVVV